MRIKSWLATISSHNAAIEYQHVFSSNLLNDFNIGFMRIVSICQPPAHTPDVADFGVPIFQPITKAIQSISISGYFSTGANPTAKFPRTGYSYIDSLRWVHGNHNLAFGVSYERDSLNMVNVLGEPGTFLFSGDTTGNALADFMLGKLRVVGQANGQGSCGTATQRSCLHWLNPASFSAPAAGSFGNVTKGEFTGPGYWDWDAGIFRDFPIKERYSVQFRKELFNAFNHTNFMDDNTGSYSKSPVQTYTAAGFGNIQAANDPRIIQMALKVVF